MANRALVAGVDSSTQSSKVELRERDSGSLVDRASAPHAHTRWDPPVSEQDPETWWEALAACFAQFSEADRARVAAISVAGQQHGLVLLGEAGEVLRPAKLWNDTTSAAQAHDLVARLSPREWAGRCGSVPLASFTIAKLAWVLDNEPHLADQIAQVMLPHDWLTWRLSGEHVTDRGDASGTGWFDPVRNELAPDLLGLAVGDPASWLWRLPRVLGPAEAAGPIAGEAAAALGLPDTLLVGPGTGDNMGAALGLGLKPGDTVISLGTSGTAYSVSRTPANDASGAVAGFADATGVYLPLVCTLNATRVTDSMARWLDVDPAGLAELALAAADGPVAPVVVPYFDGERTPDLPDATGTISGLRTDTSREQLALAAHDGVLCGLLDGLDALRSAGVDTGGRLHLIGGGARSPAYRIRAAGLSGVPVVVPHDDETVALGAAVQAAAIATSTTPAEVAAAWPLGEGQTANPPPGVDGARIRSRYAEAAAIALGP
ncbi:xylulokinase [Candidatus Poriferisocius sp.]|uniref:xylulokinase n=1 Tax=Candidatus Poriferisocius sp. TaxID=3101276 RepID=UPI003B020CC8